jgi:hypothetical protein
MRNLIRRILREETEVTKIPIKFYMFDWDDNIRYMPTKIYVKTKDGNSVEMGTEDFAHYREKMSKGIEFEYEGNIIVGLAEEPFKDFRSGYDKFKIDVMKSKKAPSWNTMVKAINTGSPLAIITARGHEPDVLKKALKDFIDANEGGISKEDLYHSLVERKESVGQEPLSMEEEIDDYLDSCLYYTVGYYYPSGGSAKPEEIKAMAMNSFKEDGKKMVEYMNDKLATDGIYDYIFVAKFGFSDDDRKNVEYAVNNTEEIDIYYTGKGEEDKVKDVESGFINPEFNKKEDLKLENRIKNILRKIIY